MFCKTCGFKESEVKLAARLGIDDSGLTLEQVASATDLPIHYLQRLGWCTKKPKNSPPYVEISYFDQNGVVEKASVRHSLLSLNGNTVEGPESKWILPKNAELVPYGVWQIPDWLREVEGGEIPPVIWIGYFLTLLGQKG